MPSYKLDHRHLSVEDVEGTAQFYETVFGARRIYAELVRGVPVIRLNLQGLWLTVSGELDPLIGHHIGFEVDDFDAAVADMREKGVEFITEPKDHGAAKVAFVRDNAGTIIEVIQRLEQPSYKTMV
ncbi:VOC family protein [Sphingopyxis macrogoltabida]|uniref:VOC domain-containing protein n=1 Tax=Sphingopyxis macrogoltabida TaxID=33050 RepID=A0AAC9AYZ9_SPHMC|nr:VOC family protein [Sphingopyxis macrogoltabida]ALJ16325.1 lactoylglutathione lyase [Sphingopyxis macrogoltabida]AMU92562.1 hypothetical protein ATM17_30345 [Sphingopyxis macrogoltabida]